MRRRSLSEQETEESCFTSESTEDSQYEHNMADLQTQIINQGNEIEHFIAIHGNKQGKSKSFVALQTLFKSFKTELSLNIKLRQALISERENYQKNVRTLTKEIISQNKFFETASQIFETKFTSFDQILLKLKSSSKGSQKAKTYVKQIHQITQQNQETEAQLSLDLAHIHSCLEQSENEKKQLENKLQLFICTCNSKDQKIALLSEQIKELQDKQLDTENKLKESEEKRFECESFLQKAESTLKSATMKAKQYRSERNALSGYLQALDMIDKRQKEILDMIQSKRNVAFAPTPPIKQYSEDYVYSDGDEMFKCMKSLQEDINNLKQDIACFHS